MIITPYRPGDEDAIIDLIVPIQTAFGIPIGAEDQPDLREIPEFYLKGCGGFWVARAGEAIVGTVALKDFGNRHLALRKMFVASDYRGAPHRLGQALLDVALSHARAAGIARIVLGTTDAFRAAHRFYERNGFALVPKADLPRAFPLMPLDTRFYVLELGLA